MDDVWARVALVAGALVVAGLVAVWQRWRTRLPVRDLVHVSLDEGVYFFSSESCPTCGRAREKLDAALGEEGYVEVAWEQDPAMYSTLGIDAVPAVLIVRHDGKATLYPGQPSKKVLGMKYEL